MDQLAFPGLEFFVDFAEALGLARLTEEQGNELVRSVGTAGMVFALMAAEDLFRYLPGIRWRGWPKLFDPCDTGLGPRSAESILAGPYQDSSLQAATPIWTRVAADTMFAFNQAIKNEPTGAELPVRNKPYSSLPETSPWKILMVSGENEHGGTQLLPLLQLPHPHPEPIYMKLAIALFGIACHGATITTTSSYQQSFGPEGLMHMSVDAPLFDSSLGRLTSFSLIGIIGIQADLDLYMGGLGGDLETTPNMQVKLKWENNPLYSLAFVEGDRINLANTRPGDIYRIPSAVDGSTIITTGCEFALCDFLLPPDRDARFSLRLLPSFAHNLPNQSYLTGTMTANFTATYNYEPAAIASPEPGTWALVAGSMTGLLYYHRRRRASPVRRN